VSRVHRVKRLSLYLPDSSSLNCWRIAAIWERWQFINLRTQGGMLWVPLGAGRMHVSRFGVLVTVTNTSSTTLWVMVRVG
jgi:hypothetical protein